MVRRRRSEVYVYICITNRGEGKGWCTSKEWIRCGWTEGEEYTVRRRMEWVNGAGRGREWNDMTDGGWRGSSTLRTEWELTHTHVPFETPLRWIIQIGLSTDFRYMTRGVRGTHGLYAMPSCLPAAFHSPHASTSTPVLLLVWSLVPVL